MPEIFEYSRIVETRKNQLLFANNSEFHTALLEPGIEGWFVNGCIGDVYSNICTYT